MNKLTMAEKLVNCDDFDILWSEVDYVDRQNDGSDIYTYLDGSRLQISEHGTRILESVKAP